MFARIMSRLANKLASGPEDTNEVFDAVVVLGGHPRVRIPAAVDWMRAGRGGVLVLVGGQLDQEVPVEVTRGKEILQTLGADDLPVLALTTEALGTVEEARVVKAAALDQGWRRVMVVTSPYHRLRATHTFQSVMGADIHIWVAATPYDDWAPDHWWKDGRQRRLVCMEVLKFGTWRTGVRRLIRPG